MAQERAAAKSKEAREGKLTARGGQPAGNSGPGQGLGNARRGFGRDAQGNPFKGTR